MYVKPLHLAIGLAIVIAFLITKCPKEKERPAQEAPVKIESGVKVEAVRLEQNEMFKQNARDWSDRETDPWYQQVFAANKQSTKEPGDEEQAGDEIPLM